MNEYYCIQCEKLHPRNYSDKEHLFLSGFQYVNSILYNVGACSKFVSTENEVNRSENIAIKE